MFILLVKYVCSFQPAIRMFVNVTIIVFTIFGIVFCIFGAHGLLFVAPCMAKREQRDALEELKILDATGPCVGEDPLHAGTRRLDLLVQSEGANLRAPRICLVCYGSPLLIGVVQITFAYLILHYAK